MIVMVTLVGELTTIWLPHEVYSSFQFVYNSFPFGKKYQ
jgi:hypothetical protein